MRSTLDQILQYKKEELESLKRKVPLKDVQLKARDVKPALDFLKNFVKDQINIIAEIKKASPSAGIIRKIFSPVDIGHIYKDHGAKALSVLTDEKFFQGSLNHLTQVKQKVGLPCLRKDFTLDEYHIYQARGAGADAILLIAAILDKHQLKDYQQLALELGMKVLCEAHSQKEIDQVMPIHPQLIGINNRDLKTLKTSLDNSLQLAKFLPKDITKISESGLNSHADLVRLMKAGYDGFLIGESLLKEKDIGKKLKELLSVYPC